MKKIDVVIPVYHPDEKFDRLVRKLCMQSKLPSSLILMITYDGEAKTLAAIWERAKKAMQGTKGANTVAIRIFGVKRAEFSHGGTRNQGIAYSDAQYVLCMTQDAVPADCFLLERLLLIFSRYPRVSSAYARQLAGSGAPAIVSLTQEYNYPGREQVKNRYTYDKFGIKNLFCSDVCCMYDREIFLSLGGFLENVNFNEDMIFARKAIDAGYQVVYAASAKVEHWHDYTLVQQFRRNFDLAVSQAEHPEVFSGLSSTKEGGRMVRRVLAQLQKKGKWGEMVRYVLLSGAKYLGYRLGLCWRILPVSFVKKCSLSPEYFTKRG